ncbi:MAG: hypothetical protein PSV35_06930 [bacterium]|nr:hypothetical protein [bacterium]
MNYINELLTELLSRLPELEWKMSGINTIISKHRVPLGLFRETRELTPAGCIAEIKADIQQLSGQKHERSAYYLADKIKQKINVLVALCQINTRTKKNTEHSSFGLKMLSTRQQWIDSMEKEIALLSDQKKALTKTLAQMQNHANTEAILSLRAELGELERRLTSAQEALHQAVM